MSATASSGFPSFEIIADKNNVLRPVVAAIARITEQATFQVTEAALSTRMVDASNTTSIDAELPAVLFERFVGQSGRFGVDVAELRDGLREINKSEPVTLRGDGSDGVIEVVARKGNDVVATTEMIDPDEIRDAPDEPGLDYSAAIDVPGDEFGRVIRASKDVGEHIFLGLKQGVGNVTQFMSVTEGDVDVTVGHPEFEFVAEGEPSESIGGLYSLDLIDSVRLGVDRPASTDIRLTWAGSEFPIKIEFSIGPDPGASMRYVVAPRITSEMDPASVLDEFEPGSFNLETVDFVADMKGGKGKQLFNLFTTFADEYRLLANEGGLEMRAVDPANVALYSVRADPGWFDSYQPVAGFPDGVVGVGDRVIDSVITKWRQNDDLELAVDSRSRFLALQHPTFTVKVAMIDPDSIRQEPELPDIPMTAKAELAAARFAEPAETIAGMSEGMSHYMSDGRYYLTTVGRDDNAVREVRARDVQGRALSVVSTDFVEKMLATLPTGEGDDLTVRAGLEFPVSFESEVDRGLLQSLFLIAPRIQSNGNLNQEVTAALSGEPVDTSWVADGDTGDLEFRGRAGFPGEPIEERLRQERLSTFPIETAVAQGTLDTGLYVKEADEIAVADDVLEQVIDDVAEQVELRVLSDGETLADVVFEDAETYAITLRNIQPQSEYRLKTADGHRLSNLIDETDNYVYLSEAADTPAEQQVFIQAAGSPSGDDYAVFVGLKERDEQVEDLLKAVVSDGHATIGNAYAALEDYAETTDLEGMVRDAGGEVIPADTEIRRELESIVDEYVDYRLEGKPGAITADQPWYAVIVGRLNIFPDASFRSDINVLKPGEEAEGYLVRQNLDLEASGPGTARIERDLFNAIVGETADRAEIPDLVRQAFDTLEQIDDVYVRRERGDIPPRSPSAGPGAREGDIAEWVEFYLPDTKAEVEFRVQDRGLPTELTDVQGIGPSRAETLNEADIRDLLDLTALTGTSKDTFIGRLLLELPDAERDRLIDTTADIWEQVIWPMRPPFPGFEEGEVEVAEPEVTEAPPRDEGVEEESALIGVTTERGMEVFGILDDAPEAVEEAMLDALNDVIPAELQLPTDLLEEGDVVGDITWQGREVVDIDFEFEPFLEAADEEPEEEIEPEEEPEPEPEPDVPEDVAVAAYDDVPVTLDVIVEGVEQRKTVRFDGPVPQRAIDRFPDEKQSDDPFAAFLDEFTGVMVRALDVDLDTVPHDTVVGEVTFYSSGAFGFEPAETIPEEAEGPPDFDEPEPGVNVDVTAPPEEQPEGIVVEEEIDIMERFVEEDEPKPDEPPEGPEDDDDDELRLPISVGETLGGRLIYVPPPNTVSIGVSEEIDRLFTDAIGPAGQFDKGTEVGDAFVTPEEIATEREIIRIDPMDQFMPEEEPEPEPEPEPEVEPEPADFSPGQLETIIEEATEGVEVQAIVFDDAIQRVELDPDFRNDAIRPGAEERRINVIPGETDLRETVTLALDAWDDMVEDLPTGTVLAVNTRRRALNEQFGLDLPLLEMEDQELIDEDTAESIIERATAGAEATVNINLEADSMRILTAPTVGTEVQYRRQPQEVRGQASRPQPVIAEAIEEWDDSVHLQTVPVTEINQQRSFIEQEFGLDIPRAEAPGVDEETADERDELLSKWQQVKGGFGLTDIDEDVLLEQPGLAIPVEVEQEVAEMIAEATRADIEPGEAIAGGEVAEAIRQTKAMEGVRQVEEGLQIHHTEDIHDEVHAIIAEVLGAEPENFYDSAKPSDLQGYDLFYEFTLSRDSDEQPWRVPRFKPSDLFEQLEPLDSDRLKVVALAAPLA